MTENKKSDIFSLLGGRKATRPESARMEPVDPAPVDAAQSAPVIPSASFDVDVSVTPTATSNPVSPPVASDSVVVSDPVAPVMPVTRTVLVQRVAKEWLEAPRFTGADAGALNHTAGATKADREIRATFIVKEGYSDALRDLAWYDRKKIKDVLNDALEVYMERNSDKLKLIEQMKKDCGPVLRAVFKKE